MLAQRGATAAAVTSSRGVTAAVRIIKRSLYRHGGVLAICAAAQLFRGVALTPRYVATRRRS